MNFTQLAQLSESEAREYLESVLWPDGPVCLHCKEIDNATKLQGKSTRPGVYKCKGCRKQFTVTVGTVMERSRVSIRHWLMAFHLLCASKKGVSAHQLHRMMGVTYKTAWFICHRIRHAMTQEPLKGMLGNSSAADGTNNATVEIDESYVGGKPRYSGQSKRGRGTSKAPVLVLIERGGKSVSMPIPDVTARSLKGAACELVNRQATVMTDEFSSYTGLNRVFKAHGVVKHKAKEYVRGDVHTNTAESYFSLLKRSVYGTFHRISRKHLHRYCTELDFRWNTRDIDDGSRRDLALESAVGKRLMYGEPIGS